MRDIGADLLVYDPLSDSSQLVRGVIFGPNISRRLGRVLGLNALPPGRAICTYRCAYCPLASVIELASSPGEVKGWLPAARVVEALMDTFEVLGCPLDQLDALVLIGNGEPTLYPELPELVYGMGKVRDLYAPEAKVAVFTNSSLLGESRVLEALSMADYVVAKLDAVDNELWVALNRPYHGLPGLMSLLRGLKVLRKALDGADGELVISTTFLELAQEGISNASEGHLRALARILSDLAPDQVHVETPLLPPGSPIRPLSRQELAEAALAIADAVGEERVFVLAGTTLPIPVRLLKHSKYLGLEAAKVRVRLPEPTRALLLEGPGARTRVKILEALSAKSMNCNQVAKAVGISWWTAQRHLERLLEAGLIRAVAFGRRTLYTITSAGLSALMGLRARASEAPGPPTRLL